MKYVKKKLSDLKPYENNPRINHTGGRVFDAIGINRWNQAYKGKAIYEAAKAIAEGVKVGETRE